jgi:dicarboxylate transporter 10
MVRMCADGVKAPEKRLNYRNAFQGMYRIAKDEGVTSLTRGIWVTTLRGIIVNATQLSACVAVLF